MDLTKVKAKYQELVEQINDQLGSTITLTYTSNTFIPITNNGIGPFGMGDYDTNGSPTKLNEIGGRFDAASSQSVQPAIYTETIVARVYWEEDVKKINHIIANNNLQIDDKLCRIVCKKQDAVKLQQCSYLSVTKDGQIVNMKAIVSKSPILYGLGENTSSAIIYCVVS